MPDTEILQQFHRVQVLLEELENLERREEVALWRLLETLTKVYEALRPKTEE